MKILIIVPSYPYKAHAFAGVFNERCAIALKKKCESVTVLVPRPIVPPFFQKLKPRWGIYSQQPSFEQRGEISVCRPQFLQVPKIFPAFWPDKGAFHWCKRMVKKMHEKIRFDVIVSFDLVGAGGLAWRLGDYLGIPSVGWATGGDMCQLRGSARADALVQTLKNLDRVFYQSHELLEVASEMLVVNLKQMSREKHQVLYRGIPDPPTIDRKVARKKIRRTWNVGKDEIVVLNIGRIAQDKGFIELLESIHIAAQKNSKIRCIIAGSKPELDETYLLNRKLNHYEGLQGKVQVLPACTPEQVWEFLCGADIFVFPSKKRYEGMPNALLEAMAMGLPTVAFGIKPVREIDNGRGGVVVVPEGDTIQFAHALLSLSDSEQKRTSVAAFGKAEIKERFSVEKNMTNLLGNLSSVIAKFQGDTSRSLSVGI